MSRFFATLYDGLQCGECAWCGPREDASEIGGEPGCGNFQCRSANVTDVHLCRTCKCEPGEWHDGECYGCHKHHFEDGTCGCGAEEAGYHRDRVYPVLPLIQDEVA